MARYQVGTITLDDPLISDHDCICDGPCIMDNQDEPVYDLDDDEPINDVHVW